MNYIKELLKSGICKMIDTNKDILPMPRIELQFEVTGLTSVRVSYIIIRQNSIDKIDFISIAEKNIECMAEYRIKKLQLAISDNNIEQINECLPFLDSKFMRFNVPIYINCYELMYQII